MNDNNQQNDALQNDEQPLEQLLLELHYGLLDDNEAQELRARIETEPDVAMQWANTLQMAGQFASAANLADVAEAEPRSLDLMKSIPPAAPILSEPTPANHTARGNVNIDINGQRASFEPMSPLNSLSKPEKGKSPEELAFQRFQQKQKQHWRWIKIVAGLAACFLMIVLGRFFSGMPVPPAMALQVEASAVQQSGDFDQSDSGPLRNQFEFFTSHLSAAQVANGVSATLSVAVKVGEAVLHQATINTDSTGKGTFAVPPNLKIPKNATLHVSSTDPNTESDSAFVLPLEPTRCLTYMTVDKPVYRPGETIRFRSLTLERYSLRPDIDLPIRFEMLDPSGAVVTGAFVEGVTDRGVGNGEFLIPTSAPGGEYTVVAKSLDDFFPDEKQTIQVRNYRVPRFKKDIEFERRSYGAGDTVKADFEAIRAEGGPLVNQSVQVTATVDGKVIFETPTTTSKSGTCSVSFKLPDRIAKGDGQLSFAVDDGGTQEAQTKTIPIQTGKVTVDFYPEGGYLVDGLVNRVYFAARNPLGEPIHIEGEILDRSGNQVAKLETVRDGMGRFEFAPKKFGRYSLKVSSPVDVTSNPRLPRVVDSLPVLETGAGVFANDADIQFSVQTKLAKEVVVQAICRGQLVAHQPISLKPGRSKMSISLPQNVEGVIRLTVLDGASFPQRPLVERLVFRESRRKLTVSVDESAESLQRSPGEQVRLSLSVVDENGEPSPAVLGIRVIDDAALSLEEDERPEMPTHFLLTSEIEKPEDLEHANFYLSGSDESKQSLDLLLGTQGWRRFVGGTDLVTSGVNLSQAGFSEQLSRLLELDGSGDHTVSVSNIDSVNQHWRAYSFAVSRNWERLMSDLRWLILPFAALLFGIYLMRPKFKLAHSGMMILMLIGFGLIPGCGSKQYTTSKSENMADASEASESPVTISGMSGEKAEKDKLLAGEKLSLPPRLKTPASELGPSAAPIPQKNPLGNIRIIDNSGSMAHKPSRFADRWRGPGSGDGESEGRGGGLGGGRGFAPRMGDDFGNHPNSKLARLLKARGLDANSLSDQLLEELRFPVREYAHQHVSTRTTMREDFAETLYWQPLLITDSNGKASIRFDLSDSVTTFKVMADAHSSDGRIGNGGGDVVSRLPLQIEPKMPLAVTTGDRIDLPVAVVNATNSDLPVDVKINPDNAFKLVGPSSLQWSLSKQQRTRGHFGLEVLRGENETKAMIELVGTSTSLSDSIQRSIQVSPAGYPARESVSGVLDEQVTVMLPIPRDAVPGSVSVSLKAYPSPLADLMSGVESILREPHGCFEQTSATNYPNTMVLLYLQQNQLANPKLTRKAKTLLDRGYQKLVSFECDKRGYEWFGSDPGHEALSAFGLLQFDDMAQVMAVDAEMVVRTRTWLMDRRDGKGSFKRNPRSLHSWSVKQEVVDAYVLWAVTESDLASGNPQRSATELLKELNLINEKARTSKNPYLVSLAAASMMNVGRKSQGEFLLNRLVDMQLETGHLQGSVTVTQSGGQSKKVETTALAMLAWSKSDKYVDQIRSAAHWLAKNRNGNGGFGSTQGTVLALKALVAFSKIGSPKIPGGTLYVKQNNEVIGEAKLPEDPRNGSTIEITGLGSKILSGESEIELVADGVSGLPFSVEILYHTMTPPSDKRCPFELTTKFDGIEKTETKTGTVYEPVPSGSLIRVKAELINKTESGQPMTIATIGLPGGVEPRVEQLNELRDAGMFDYYEIRPREVICYWRTIAPNETKKIEFDVTAEVSGRYTGPASRAYLYYTAEQKVWTSPLRVEIER
ncbi:MAG: MG2 domain-containing protein [Mariniblastus sp.]